MSDAISRTVPSTRRLYCGILFSHVLYNIIEQLEFTKTMFQKLGATIKVQTNTSILFMFSSCVGFKSRPLTIPFITRMSMFSLIKS